MKRLMIICILAVNIVVIWTITSHLSYANRVDRYFDILNDDQIRIYNQAGYTIDEQSLIENIPGIKTAEFDNRNLFPYFIQDYGEQTNIVMHGITIDPGSNVQSNLTFIAGQPVTKEYQVVINQHLAAVMIKLGVATDIDSLVGQELVKGLTISGVVDIPRTSCTKNYVVNYDYVLNKPQNDYSYGCANSFLLLNRGKEFSTELTESELEQYGGKFNQYGFIEVEPNQKSQVVSALQRIDQKQLILTNDSSIGNNRESTVTWLLIILLAICLELIVLVPIIKNARS